MKNCALLKKFRLFSLISCLFFVASAQAETTPSDAKAAQESAPAATPEKAPETAGQEIMKAQAEASTTPAERGAWTWMVQLGSAYSSTNVNSTGSTPTLATHNLGFSGSWNFGSDHQYSVGLATDYYMVNQVTDPTASAGNYQGTRLTYLEPSFGYTMGSWSTILDLELMGTYTLVKTATDGSTLSYKNPTGFKIREYRANLWHHFGAGAQYENVSYSKGNSSSAGDFSLSTNQTFWQLGVFAGYIF